MLGLADPTTTPVAGETLSEFFRRTVASWSATVGLTLGEGDRLTGKELRRRAFALAQARFEELWPVLEEMNELEQEQERLEMQSRSRAKGAKGGKGGKGAGAGAGAGAGDGKKAKKDKKKDKK
jgi:hypothetical protein